MRNGVVVRKKWIHLYLIRVAVVPIRKFYLKDKFKIKQINFANLHFFFSRKKIRINWYLHSLLSNKEAYHYILLSEFNSVSNVLFRFSDELQILRSFFFYNLLYLSSQLGASFCCASSNHRELNSWSRSFHRKWVGIPFSSKVNDLLNSIANFEATKPIDPIFTEQGW